MEELGIFTTLFYSKVYVGFVVKVHHKNPANSGCVSADLWAGESPMSPERWMERIQLTPDIFVGCNPGGAVILSPSGESCRDHFNRALSEKSPDAE